MQIDERDQWMVRFPSSAGPCLVVTLGTSPPEHQTSLATQWRVEGCRAVVRITKADLEQLSSNPISLSTILRCNERQTVDALHSSESKQRIHS